MRLLVLTNRPDTKVGYGILATNLLPEFKKDHDVALMTNWGIDGEDIVYLQNYPGIPVYGKGDVNYNEHLVKPNYDHFKADLLLVIWDAWGLSVVLQNAREGQLVLVPYFPIDTDTLTENHRNACEASFRIIPMSQHGEDIFRKHFPEKTLPHIPVGVDTKIFKPLWDKEEEKGKWKEKLGFRKEQFVIGLAGDIKTRRKRWAENLEGVKKFIMRNPSFDVGVFIHARDSPSNPGDTNIKQLINYYDLNVRMTENLAYLRTVSHKEMAELYNGFDVFLQCSAGEGGGMQLIEAQACGTPVIATKYTSCPQMVSKKSSLLVDPIMLELDYGPSLKAIPNPDHIALCLETLYNETKSDVMSIKKDAVEFAKKFDWDTVIFPLWKRTLKKVEEDLKRACVKPPNPEAELLKTAKVVKLLE